MANFSKSDVGQLLELKKKLIGTLIQLNYHRDMEKTRLEPPDPFLGDL